MTDISAGYSRSFAGVAVTVVGVAATRQTNIPTPRSAWTAMDDYAALIAARTPVRALRLPLADCDVHAVAARIAGLKSRVSAVLVVGLRSPEDSATLRREVAKRSGPFVLTELDAVTAALTAAAITTLRAHGTLRHRGRVVVASPRHAPLIGAVLTAAGAGSVMTWDENQAPILPLHRLMQDRDVLIDLRPSYPRPSSPDKTVSIPVEPFEYGGLVVPGLLSAVCGNGVPTLTTGILAACARALALVTPDGRNLPQLNERLLVPAIARRVSGELVEPTNP